MGPIAPTSYIVDRLEKVGSARTPPQPSGTRMKAGVVGSKREHRTRTEQCLKLESTVARTLKNPQRESIGVGGRPRVFSKLVL